MSNRLQKMGTPMMIGKGNALAVAVPTGWMTLSAAAAYTARHHKTLRRAVESGKLPRRQPAGPRGNLYFIKEELDAYMNSGRWDGDGQDRADGVPISEEPV